MPIVTQGALETIRAMREELELKPKGVALQGTSGMVNSLKAALALLRKHDQSWYGVMLCIETSLDSALRAAGRDKTVMMKFRTEGKAPGERAKRLRESGLLREVEEEGVRPPLPMEEIRRQRNEYWSKNGGWQGEDGEWWPPQPEDVPEGMVRRPDGSLRPESFPEKFDRELRERRAKENLAASQRGAPTDPEAETNTPKFALREGETAHEAMLRHMAELEERERAERAEREEELKREAMDPPAKTPSTSEG